MATIWCRRAKEAAAASEREAAAAAEEAERATWQAEQGESEGVQDDQAFALRQAAAKWTKRYSARCHDVSCVPHGIPEKFLFTLATNVMQYRKLSLTCWQVSLSELLGNVQTCS